MLATISIAKIIVGINISPYRKVLTVIIAIVNEMSRTISGICDDTYKELIRFMWFPRFLTLL